MRRGSTLFGFFFSLVATGLSPRTARSDPGPSATDDQVLQWIAVAISAWIDPNVPDNPGHPGAASPEQLALAECLKGLTLALESEAAAAAPVPDQNGVWPTEHELMVSTRPERRVVLSSTSALFRQERDHMSVIGEQWMRFVRIQSAASKVVIGLEDAMDYALRYDKYNSPPFPPVPPLEEIPQWPTWLAPHWMRAAAGWKSLASDAIVYDGQAARARSPSDVEVRTRAVCLEHAPKRPRPAKPGTPEWWSYLRELEEYFAKTAEFIGSTSRLQEFESYGSRIVAASGLHATALRPSLLSRVRRTLERARLLGNALGAEHKFLDEEAVALTIEEAAHAAVGLQLDAQRKGVEALQLAATAAKSQVDAEIIGLDKLRAKTPGLEAAEAAAREDVSKKESALVSLRYSCTHGHASPEACPDATQVTAFYREIQRLDGDLATARRRLSDRAKDVRDHRFALAQQQSLVLKRRGEWLDARSRHSEASFKYASDFADYRYAGARLREKRDRNIAESALNSSERGAIQSFLDGRWIPSTP